MAAFTGTAFPYWMSINSNGSTGSAGAQSENIPVSPGGLYTFTVTAAYQSTYASGAQVTVTFYNASGISQGATSVTQSAMTGGQTYQWSTGQLTAPATSAYAIALVRAVGTPAATNALQVYQAEFQDGNNNQVNINFAFTYTYAPWFSINSSTVQWNYSPLLNGDADSLTLDGVIELMGGQQGVMSDIPQLLDSNGQGPTFRILAPASLNSTAFGYQTSYDLNAPQPTQDVVASMLLDGERPFGTRSSNRTISLPIIIFGTQAGGMNQVLKAREFLASVIDRQTWKMIWTSADTGLPLVFDCFRALPSTPIYGFNHSAGGTATGTIGRPNFPAAMMTIAVQALPYGRSDVDGRQNLAFTNSLVSGPQPNNQQLIDNYATTAGIRQVGNTNSGAVTSATFTLTESVPAGDTIVVAMGAPNSVTQTVTVSDSKGNTYVAQSSIATGTANASSIFTFTATAISKALTGNTDTITVHTTNSQNMDIAVLAVTQGFNIDNVGTNSGTSATPSVATTAPTSNDNISIAFFLNNNGKGAGTPTGWNQISSNNNGAGLEMAGFWTNNTGQVAQTATSSYGSSVSYVAASVVVDIKAGYYWVSDTTHSVNPGTTSAHFLAPRPMVKPWPAATYTASLASAVNIAGLPVLSMWFGQSYDSQWPKDPKFVSNVTMSWTLWDNQGRTLNFNTTQKKCSYGSHPSTPKWTRISARIPQGNPLFNYSALTAYSVRITNWSGSGHSGYVRMHAWLNGLYANPQTISNAMSPRGTVYNLFSLPGTARSPISVQCQLPAASNITKELTTPASGYWIVPPGVYSVQAECWAGGGAGASLNLSRAIAGGGGGGGEYAQEPSLAVTPGQKVPWTIGAAGTPAQLASTVVQYLNPGMGHWTCPPNVTQVLAECWGGGGAGGAGSGGGGGGEYTSGYIQVTPGTTYNLWTASGGKADTGTTARAVAARQGGTSWFGPASALVGSQAYLQAIGGKTSITGGSSGGLGGTGPALGQAPQAATNSFGSVTVFGGWNLAAATTSSVQPYGSHSTLPAGNTGMIVVTVAAPTTVTITDSSGNNWVQVASKAASSGSVSYVFLCIVAKALNGTSVLTVNQGISQTMALAPFNIPYVCGQDAAITTALGTSSTPSITSGTPSNAGDLVFAVFGNAAANTNSTPSGWSHLGTLGAGSGSWQDVFYIQNTSSSSAETCSPTYAASEVWEAITITLQVETHWPGGRGGSAPGSSGGGGGGAAGATGAGGPGANSQPYVNAQGRWPGGAGGTGTGLGGAGGAGAGTPGFPGAGANPGGGGGGGYQNLPLFNASNPSLNIPGSQQVNFLGGDGGNGMVQLTYAVGGGNPVNGGNTTFGSSGTTTTTVTAHGGTSAASNSAAGGTGGTGSTNTIASAGGAGGLNTGGTLGSYLLEPSTSTFFQTLANISTTNSHATSAAAASSCSQGVAVAVFTTSVPITDSVITDSAGNVYQLSSMQGGGAAQTGVTTYAYVADIEYPITTSTTLTWSSASTVVIGLLWYASPYLAGGVTSANTGTGHGNGTSFTAQYATTDTASQVVEVALISTDSSRTLTGFTSNLGKVFLAASSTNSIIAGQYTLNAFASITQAGGTGSTGTGDTVAGTISATANWSQVNLQFTLINQQAAVARIDWRAGGPAGTQSTWATELAVAPSGMILMVGQAGSGASITTGPTAVADAAGNVYTVRGVTTLPSNQGIVFLATAPVTAALTAGTTGTVNWGAASGAPNAYFNTYWVPNAVSSIDVHGVSATTGSGTSVTGSYAPGNPNDVVFAVAAVGAAPLPTFSAPGAPWNSIDSPFQANLNGQVYAAQATDEGTLSFATTLSIGSAWACLMIGMQMQLAGTGGGAAGGAAGPGYPGVWQYGGYGYSGGGTGKGGAGAATVNTAGGGAAKPGGGGGGAYSNASAAQSGGQGAQGAIRLTWTPPLQTMNNLIVHSLGPDSDPNVSPICPIPITDTPNNTEYNWPSVNGLLPATFNSTYSIILANYVWNSATSSSPRQITVTINQYEYPGGPRYSVQVSRAITPATDAVNGLLSMGEVTLPIKDYIAYNDQSYFTVSINDTDTSDRFMDVLALDTLGQSVLINIDPGQPGFGKYVNYFIDEATPDRDLGFIGASFQDRQHQVSVLDYAQVSGGALYIAAGDNLFLTYSTAGAPDLAVNYEPRWYLDRIE